MSPRRAVVGLLATVAAVGVLWTGRGLWTSLPGPVNRPDDSTLPAFVGTDACVSCHEGAANAWRDSHHDLAMQPASDDTVRGDFDDATFGNGETRTRFFKREDRFYVNAFGPDGRPEDFEIRYTFGVDPLQQYLVALPQGHVQGLTVAWDMRAERWFSLASEAQPAPGDPFHWTGRYQRWNVMCAECHSTNLRRNYDAETDTYATAWSDLDVGCEACHGPGADHLRWADDTAAGSAADDPTFGLLVRFPTGPDGQASEVRACAPCHSRRQPLAPNVPTSPLLDAYLPVTLREGLYHADGQILDEVYVYGSFVQSRMYAAGVRCTNCHDPHRLTFEVTGNAICVQCHRETPVPEFPTLRPRAYDTTTHHHHPDGSAGAQCVNCHMPARTYMQIDPRRDHSFRIPRPDLSVRLGTPNACTGCHTDREDAWAAAATASWFGATDTPHFAEAIYAGREGDPNAWRGLSRVATDPDVPAIVRATAVELLAPYGLAGADAVAAGTRDPTPLVREVAAGSLEGQPPDTRLTLARPLLVDPVRAVRVEAARVLASTGPDGVARLTPDQRSQFEAALEEFVAAQQMQADLPPAHLNLGVLREHQRREADAERAYRRALVLDADFLPARFNLATLLSRLDRNDEAEALLREGVQRSPEDGELHYSLGLLLAEEGRLAEAIESLGRASARLARARVHYNHGLALQQAGRLDEAETALLEARRRDRTDADVVLALATLYRDRADWGRAATYATTLTQLRPGDPGPRALLQDIQRQRAQ